MRSPFLRRRTPLTGAQVRRFHLYRFGAAIATFACSALTTLVVLASVIEGARALLDISLLAVLVLLSAYMLRVARRRWRRIAISEPGTRVQPTLGAGQLSATIGSLDAFEQASKRLPTDLKNKLIATFDGSPETTQRILAFAILYSTLVNVMNSDPMADALRAKGE